MADCPQPGESGFVAGVFLAYALRVGLRHYLDGKVGVDLVDSLQERFPKASLEMMQGVASTVMQGVDAAREFSAAGPDALPDLASWPTVPADFYFASAAAGMRTLAITNVSFQGPEDQLGKRWNIPVAGIESDTLADMAARAQEEATEEAVSTPEAQWERELMELAHAWDIDIVFVAKKF